MTGGSVEIIDGAPSDTGPRLVLARGGEFVLVGVLTFICSVPLVTAVAAQAAGWQTLDPRHAGTPGMTGRYFRSLRHQLGPGLPLQLLWLAATAVAVMDFWFGLASRQGSPPAVIFAGLGGLGLVLLLILRPFLAAGLLTVDQRPARLPIMISAALATAGISPWRTALVLAIDVAVIFAGSVALILVPAALTIALPLQWQLINGSHRALVSARASRRPRG